MGDRLSWALRKVCQGKAGRRAKLRQAATVQTYTNNDRYTNRNTKAFIVQFQSWFTFGYLYNACRTITAYKCLPLCNMCSIFYNIESSKSAANFLYFLKNTVFKNIFSKALLLSLLLFSVFIFILLPSKFIFIPWHGLLTVSGLQGKFHCTRNVHWQ